MSTTWEDVEIPQGSFIGWHEIGQKVTGKVVSFAAEGGTDFNQNPCPQIVIELTESALNFKEKGAERETIEAGEFVTITCGQANLKRGIIAAQPTNGDLMQIHYEGTYKAAKGDGKTFKVRIARGAAKRDEGDLI